MNFIGENNKWISKPNKFEIQDNDITITTEPHTDLWQRTYYGFQNDNAPALLLPVQDRYFTFTVRTEFDTKRRFDQCGVIIYQSSDNWFKASIEYENEEFQRLGSVVTNNGYSDWATTDIPAKQKHMYYRLSRRESDFCIECSYDGKHYKQMRTEKFESQMNSSICTTQFKRQRKMQDKSYPAFYIALIYFIYWT